MKDNTKPINKYLLWLSICAVFPNQEKAALKSPKALLRKYLERQIRRHRYNYVNYCLNNKDVALAVATQVFYKRKIHDFDYYEAKDV